MSKQFNESHDLKILLIFDTNPFNTETLYEQDISERSVENLKGFYEELYKLQKTQTGYDDENRDYDVGPDNLLLPKTSTLVLPRAKRLPKQKALTKWERFRKEKGLSPRKKRSRMIYSETAQDWVPRWGPGR